MARTIILAILAAIMVYVSAQTETRENELVKYGKVSGRVNIPDVEIKKWQLPQLFVDTEKLWRLNCCVTTNFTNIEDLTLAEDSDEMKQINEIVKEVNEIGSKFEAAQKSGTYKYEKSDRTALESLAAKLKVIDAGLPDERRDNHEGSLILGICVDIHSILTYMLATRTR
ncbi:uncharacterized protein LOC129570022 [Sitodiplosis mosellana]|uniref:uncharacterized protein LOC129570022 n=1 Tax=Sitodiplosis mosellana TaxID=263140 RepID=UPI0024437966|nr:uncharacterized protein LOC129570022 [Sitodiplosis mosellana]